MIRGITQNFDFLSVRHTLVLFVLTSTPGFSFPEMARLGYFSCTTCHISPSGGGILTPYGRAFSAERLSTFHRNGEERPFHGALKEMPQWLLVGGDARYVQTDYEDATSRRGRWVRMQTDLAIAVNLPNFTLAAAGGPHGDSQTNPKLSGKASWRSYFAKIDFSDFSFRYGRFYPRFGLNIPEHTANIRSGLGFDQGQENQCAEVNWISALNEITLTRMMGARKQELDGSRESGYAINLNHFLAERHRIGINFLAADDKQKKRFVYGLYGLIVLTERWFVEAEADHQTLRPNGSPPLDQRFFWGRLGYEAMQGVVPFLNSEVTLSDIRNPYSRTDNFSLGMGWFPRPHFEFSGSVGATLSHRDYSFATIAYLILHYYL